MQLASRKEKEQDGSFYSCDMVLGKTLHPVFSSCEVVLNPPNPHARRHPVTQIARETERGNEREGEQERESERD